MKLEAYAVFDVKAQVFSRPYFCASEVLAMREVRLACADPNSLFSKCPEDFRLFRIGVFDDADGTIVPEGLGPVFIAGAFSQGVNNA